MEIKFFEDGKELSIKEVINSKIDKSNNIVNVIQCCVEGLSPSKIHEHILALKQLFMEHGVDIIPLAIPDLEHRYIFNQLQIKGDK